MAIRDRAIALEHSSKNNCRWANYSWIACTCLQTAKWPREKTLIGLTSQPWYSWPHSVALSPSCSKGYLRPPKGSQHSVISDIDKRVAACHTLSNKRVFINRLSVPVRQTLKAKFIIKAGVSQRNGSNPQITSFGFNGSALFPINSRSRLLACLRCCWS